MTTRKPRTRARRGDHSIHFDQARGCYEGSVSLGLDPVTGKRLRPKFRGATVQEVRAKIGNYLRERESGIVTPESYTVGQCVSEYLQALPDGPTAAGYRSTAGAWLLPGPERARELLGLGVPLLAGVRLRDLSVRAHLDPFFAAVAPHRAPRTLSSILSMLRNSVHRAQVHDLVSRNICDLVRLPAGKPVRPARAMTVEQVNVMLAATEGTPVYALLYLLFTTGPRSGELRGLRWEDINLDARTVSYTRNLKNAGSRRRVRVSPACAEVLREHRAAQARIGGLVFCRDDGTEYTKDGIGYVFRKAAEAAGLGHWHIHEGRHTAASVLDFLGVRGQDVSDVLGHKNEVVTKKVYRHLLAPEIKGGADSVDGVFGRAAGE